MAKNPVDPLLATYRGLILEWIAEQSSERKGAGRRAHRKYERIQETYESLRKWQAGRDGITALIQDPDPAVRSVAASHALQWSRIDAVKALEELASAHDAPREVQMNAAYTLGEFKAGRLSAGPGSGSA